MLTKKRVNWKYPWDKSHLDISTGIICRFMPDACSDADFMICFAGYVWHSDLSSTVSEIHSRFPDSSWDWSVQYWDTCVLCRHAVWNCAWTCLLVWCCFPWQPVSVAWSEVFIIIASYQMHIDVLCTNELNCSFWHVFNWEEISFGAFDQIELHLVGIK